MTTTAWRDFERLVARIEHALAGEGVTVTSPDFIPCITTGTAREVDASIRTRVGSAEILITVECRDRVSVQDVTWVEQLSTKKRNIGAAKTIAVAASGFSAEAARIARENVIDLRVLDEITEDDIRSWMPLVGLVHVFKDCDFTRPPEIQFIAQPGDEVAELTFSDPAPGGLYAQHIFRGPNDEPLSLNDIWLRVDDQGKFFDKVPRDNKDYFVELTITPADSLYICTPIGNRQIESITLPLRLRWKHEDLDLSEAKFLRYRSAATADSFPEQVLVEFETKQAGTNNIRVGFQMQPQEEMVRVSVELIQTESGAG